MVLILFLFVSLNQSGVKVNLAAFSYSFDGNDDQGNWDNQMRNQLIDLDQHKHELTKKQLRTEYVHSFALYADDVGIPVEIEY